MNRTLYSLLVIVTAFLLNSCTFINEKIYIACLPADSVSIKAGKNLSCYLSQTYGDKRFEFSGEKMEGNKNIVLEIVTDIDLKNNEAYKISGSGNELLVRGKTPRALQNGIYGLLKELGWNFYLSFEVPPSEPKPLDFSAIHIENAPLKEKRIIFNWHNFISGCTGWDYAQWQQWIDNASKIGFNTVMVHAYGNNPMCSFSCNGKEKELGYLTTTQKGRDWGAEHVNDVRLLHGGEIFTAYEFGSEAAKVPEKERGQAATALMKRVFRHAAANGMGVCFAVDVDTWMANPQNIINTFPEDALISVGGYKTLNPEHPEGKKYYRAQIQQLLSDYPEITMLSTWMRRPRKKSGLGSVWLLHESNTLPEKWKQEYFNVLKDHPGMKDERPNPGLFAISKIVKTYREILDELNPEIELVLGSWETDYTEQASPFMPDYCGFIPLDYSYSLNQPQVKERLNEVGKTHKLYPVVWAHHDDHRYIGRPYIPFSDFNTLLDETNSSGYGIIHWMTHPLDLFFSNYEDQVWQNSGNETLNEAIGIYTNSLLKKEDENLYNYFDKWFNSASMFGRETSDHFLKLDDDYTLESYGSSQEVIEKAKQRLAILTRVDKNALNTRGEKEFNYQLGMEKFIISFFTNHDKGHKAFKLLQNGTLKDALPLVQTLNPSETIGLYAETIKEYGATRGEEGILVSLNLRWLPDYIDLKQRAGLEPVRINFQPTSHDPLAQAPGEYTFFVDRQKNFCLSLGEKELKVPAETNGKLPLEEITGSWISISKELEIPIKTMRGFDLTASDYEIQLLFAPQSVGCRVQIINDEQIISSLNGKEGTGTIKGNFNTNGKKLMLKIIPGAGGTVKLAGLIINSAN